MGTCSPNTTSRRQISGFIPWNEIRALLLIMPILIPIGGCPNAHTETKTSVPQNPGPPIDVDADTSFEHNNKRRAVIKTLDNYINALVEGDGSTAADLLDRETHAWYQKTIRDALTIDRVELERSHIVRKMTILRLRDAFSKAALKLLTSRQVVIHGARNSWFSTKPFKTVQPGRVVFKENVAWLYQRKNQNLLLFPFAKEKGRWCLAAAKTFQEADRVFKEQVKGTSAQNNMIIKIIEKKTGREIDPAIWNGPREH